MSSSVILCHSSAARLEEAAPATRGECPIRQLSRKAEAPNSSLSNWRAAAGANYSETLTASVPGTGKSLSNT